ncbi:MAG: putative molybdenum carrier protein [Acidobacteriota bacterium]
MALALGLACGGWCPAGRWSEDGRIAAQYPLRETPSPDPAERTRANVRDSDATLILARGRLSGGSLLTLETARQLGRPVLVVQLEHPSATAVSEVRNWLERNRVSTLNVAGPRESECPGIYEEARRFLSRLLESPEVRE